MKEVWAHKSPLFIAVLHQARKVTRHVFVW